MEKEDSKYTKTSRKYANIFRIRIDSTSIEKVLGRIREKIAKNKRFVIFTPNPEIVLKADDDESFAKILNSADIKIADGVGLAAAVKFLNLPKTNNTLLKPILYFAQGLGVGFSVIFDRKWVESDLKVIKGRELFEELVRLANKKRWSVYLLGGKDGSAKGTAENLQKSYKKMKFGYTDGPQLDESAKPIDKVNIKIEKDVVRDINKFEPQILFVAFGAPKQEKWLYRYIKKLNIGGAMVVGSTFDYFAGKRKMPPKWMEKIGLEWLWRLLTGSQRIGRIVRATVIFPIKVFQQKLQEKN